MKNRLSFPLSIILFAVQTPVFCDSLPIQTEPSHPIQINHIHEHSHHYNSHNQPHIPNHGLNHSLLNAVSLVFDAPYYTKTYEKELKDTNLTPLEHFLSIGWRKDYNPNSWFDIATYKKYFPCPINPLIDWLTQPKGTSHTDYAKQDIVVSLTSHPPRIHSTWLAIESMMRQEVKPKKIILNLALEDFPDKKIPQSLEILKDRGLEIHFSDVNYRVATKILPTLEKFPNAGIITIDDDRIYTQDLLKTLLTQSEKFPNTIVCAQARRFIYTNPHHNETTHSDPSYPYHYGYKYHHHGHHHHHNRKHYDKVTKFGCIDYLAQDPIYDKPTLGGIFEGYAGVYYPPRAFNKEVLNFKNFLRFTPYADDVWLQAMALYNNTPVVGLPKEITEKFLTPLEVDGTQEAGLFHHHLHANGVMAYRVLAYYGLLKTLNIPDVEKIKCPNCKRTVHLFKKGEAKDIDQTPTHLRNDGKKCKTCLNRSKLKILCVGAYDFGNMGDTLYKDIFTHYFGKEFEVVTIPNVVRINEKGNYIGMSSKDKDFKYDVLIVGGGGILKDFPNHSSFKYYLEQALKKDKPVFIVSVGLQTSNPDPSIEEASTLLGQTKELLQQATLITPRSTKDYALLRSILGDEHRHKIIPKADLGYYYPKMVGIDHTKEEKKYITLIQTGSANLNNVYVRSKIDKYSKKYPNAQLIIMNMGGIVHPGKEKDFPEWHLYTTKVQELYPHAKVYMGGSLSPQLIKLKHRNAKIRAADLTPYKSAKIIAQSHVVITGRYHGKVLTSGNTKCYTPIYTYKCVEEKNSGLNPKNAKDVLKYIKFYLNDKKANIPTPASWTEDQRNTHIIMAHEQFPNLPVSFLQSMHNTALYHLLNFGVK